MNPDGWGPTTLPVQFLDKPYAPFSKTEKLGRIADFSSRNRYGRCVLHRMCAPGGGNVAMCGDAAMASVTA